VVSLGSAKEGLFTRVRESILRDMCFRGIFLCLAGAMAANVVLADTWTGAGWTVRFNLPDQNSTNAGPDEFVIRDAFLARINALDNNDWACLATYTFTNQVVAGQLLEALGQALTRGAKIGFVADKGVDIASNFWPGLSLSGLAARSVNPLQLSRCPFPDGIMHNKTGVFWYRAATQAWVLSGSWNFTGAGSSEQWNILTEIQDNALAGAYSNEMRELLEGRFHSDPAKSHAHDGTRFRLPGMHADGWVRFAPYPSAAPGGSNALTDITAAIDAAQEEIFFGLNLLTRSNVVEALARACNRGVVVHGVIPKSDQYAPDSVYSALLQPVHYATRNRVVMFPAYYNAERTRRDGGSWDLVHAKYMVIDPRGARPWVIHGLANWTWSALVSTSTNDENVQFLPHAGMAAAFLAHFARMSDGVQPWCAMGSGGSSASAWLDYWLPDDTLHELVWTGDLHNPASWTNRVQLLPARRGTNTLNLARDPLPRFFRVQRVPPAL